MSDYKRFLVCELTWDGFGVEDEFDSYFDANLYFKSRLAAGGGKNGKLFLFEVLGEE